MSTDSGSTYLGATIDVDRRNAIISALLIHYIAPNSEILDVGCAAGTIAAALPTYKKYLGTDVSSVAIKEANEQSLPNTEFAVSDMRTFTTDQSWDVVMFNEVLYYIDERESVEQVLRYSKFLRQNGLIVISMKDDAKSHYILKKILPHFKWVDGVLWQRKRFGLDYRVRADRESPALHLMLLRKN